MRDDERATLMGLHTKILKRAAIIDNVRNNTFTLMSRICQLIKDEPRDLVPRIKAEFAACEQTVIAKLSQ